MVKIITGKSMSKLESKIEKWTQDEDDEHENDEVAITKTKISKVGGSYVAVITYKLVDLVTFW